jgi:hypothetical protein
LSLFSFFFFFFFFCPTDKLRFGWVGVGKTNHIQEFWAKPEFLVTLASRLEDLEHNVATISGECSELKKDLALANLKNERLSAEVATLRQVVLRRRAQIPAHQGA